MLPLLARLDRWVRRLVVSTIPPAFAVWFYSQTRRWFLERLARAQPERYVPPPAAGVECWGLRFQTPIFNAAGMFKAGRGYSVAYRQGAGAFLAGTVTLYPRRGNRKGRIVQPFLSYPRSQAASNWLGLPNPGYQYVVRQLQQFLSQPGCPRGISIAPPDELAFDEAADALVDGLFLFKNIGIDFVEINESCPNTQTDREAWDLVWKRLEIVREKFLRKRKRFVPVVVKFSNDVPLSMVADIVAKLCDLGFDGVNFGNTSTNYSLHRERIHLREQRYYDFFVQNFGGGVSGRPLKEESLLRCLAAVEYLREHPPAHEFVVIRTGGILDAEDVAESLQRGIHLCQWYTGYFEQFAQWGHRLYQRIVEHLLSS